jgi:AcrR family transcriptional regulator/DNA-binding transcriptional ArsR family regulator
MVETPWGPAASLAGRRLPPGPGTPAREVSRNQRERLFGAMVACVATKGYASTRVADLIDLSGVGRKSFYDHFADKQACFRATVEALVGRAMARADAIEDADIPREEELRRLFDLFTQIVVRQPAAARMFMLEAYAAGPEALRPVEDSTRVLERRLHRIFAEDPERAAIPKELIDALLDGWMEVCRHLLIAGREAELLELAPEIMDFVLSYRPPPQPLRLSQRPPAPSPEAIEGHDHAERALRAFAVVVAERGYAATTVEEVVKRASMSPTTFYANFTGKEDALTAAIDGAGAQIGAVVLSAFRRSPDWPNGVRAAFGAFFNFLASRPALAHLLMSDVLAAGPKALGRRREALRPLSDILAAGRDVAPQVPEVGLDLIAGAINGLAYRQIRDHGPETLSSLAPLATFLTLAPFLGPQVACELANSDGRPREHQEPVLSEEWETAQVLKMLGSGKGSGGSTAAAIAAELEMPVEDVQRHLDVLMEAELVKVAGEEGGARLYRAHLPIVHDAAWEAMSRSQREKMSKQIGLLIMENVLESVRSGLFDAKPERHLSRVGVEVDAEGWSRIMDIHDETLYAVLREVEAGRRRLRESGEEPIRGYSVQTLFEGKLPRGFEKETFPEPDLRELMSPRRGERRAADPD